MVKNEIGKLFHEGNILTKLILVNVLVWIAVNLALVTLFLFNISEKASDEFIRWFAVPARVSSLLFKPWTLITYMFLHESFIHILFNMLWLYWFGKIFLEYLGSKQFLGVYILGGISGALLYVASFNIFPVFSDMLPLSFALGASASVLAIVIAISTYIPNFSLHLLFIGPVKLKYIAIITVLLDLLSIKGDNAGGHIAHLGGAIFGFYFTRTLQNGYDLTKGFSKILESCASYFYTSGKNLHVSYSKVRQKGMTKSDEEYNYEKKARQQEIDKILDKISKSGYASLSKEEKDLLFKITNEKL